ncbi:MAG: hypothetical protein B7Y80_20430 [Hyphomicrobium sp. 32-62-53]|nr:MAG: hypothetical protein B7Z29_20265 [Hyphomicrobium sp. 12-62-95]OYX97249.1 MAG: hypothetical protein B7Y80_20430 [Hyphomicrobium sp. 32-62-53]
MAATAQSAKVQAPASEGHHEALTMNTGKRATMIPSIAIAALPLLVVVCTNFLVTQLALPNIDGRFLAEQAYPQLVEFGQYHWRSLPPSSF